MTTLSLNLSQLATPLSTLSALSRCRKPSAVLGTSTSVLGRKVVGRKFRSVEDQFLSKPSRKLQSSLPSHRAPQSFWRMGNTSQSAAGNARGASNESTGPKVKLSDEEWRQKLTPEQYRVARKKGTEMAGTGALLKEKRNGTFVCICCNTPLFSSDTKFESGTGWPSFFDKISNVGEHRDSSIPFMPRVEVVCDVCDAHLGHVFNDGPRPTGKRYCINSVSLKFEPK